MPHEYYKVDRLRHHDGGKHTATDVGNATLDACKGEFRFDKLLKVSNDLDATKALLSRLMTRLESKFTPEEVCEILGEDWAIRDMGDVAA